MRSINIYFYYFFYGGYVMNEVIEKENIKIKDMIYEIRGMQVILDREISATKWHVIKLKIY